MSLTSMQTLKQIIGKQKKASWVGHGFNLYELDCMDQLDTI